MGKLIHSILAIKTTIFYHLAHLTFQHFTIQIFANFLKYVVVARVDFMKPGRDVNLSLFRAECGDSLKAEQRWWKRGVIGHILGAFIPGILGKKVYASDSPRD